MNIRTRRISRRTVLRGAGAAISLPLLDIMGAPVSAKTGNQKLKTTENTNRIAYLYFPNGVARGSIMSLPLITVARIGMNKIPSPSAHIA